MTKNSNGTNKIIGHGETCLVPTGDGHTKKEPTVSNQPTEITLNIRSAQVNESFVESQTMKKEDHFYVLLLFCFYMMLFIVNNGNILTDGRNERKYFYRKYNEL